MSGWGSSKSSVTVACVEVGNYLGRGAEYVAKLKAMVARHLSVPHSFCCLTDDPKRHPELSADELQDLSPAARDTGWWAKVHLFAPGRFSGRVVFLDLDTVVVGLLDALAQSKGIVHLDHWGWDRKVYGSAVMVWDAGEHAEIFERFTSELPARLRGDQDWMTELGGWDVLPQGLCCSYRYHAVDGPPRGASVICFHGKPKPHDLPPDHWALKHWS